MGDAIRLGATDRMSVRTYVPTHPQGDVVTADYNWLTERRASLLGRFFRHVDIRPNRGCWLWTASTSGDGYGQFGLRAGQNSRAHRTSYQLLVGPIPAGYHLHHICKTPRCVNPAHLAAVTPRENQMRSDGQGAVNAAKTECKHGHPFTPENTRRNSKGGRTCITCSRAYDRERYTKRFPRKVAA